MMPPGPGKYDDLCRYVLERSEASAALVIIFDGRKGTGFSANFDNPLFVPSMVDILRDVADQIEKDLGTI